ncbi:TonB-dependent siderophore receptor [uncultured Pseudomonas sp.]|uniref:TonB-dependent siderophore receptor n=1 Tax=uncultured Pseudomonas sp. TaxID=114707 RepID=UPI0025E7F5C4|nr:TonB-dependent siderophore receptor [uncultured Pseudomonas sp.]
MSRVVRRSQPLARAVRAALLSLSLPLALLPVVTPAWAAQSYQVSAGALDAALTEFARQSGVLLSFDPALTRGRSSSGLQGHYSLEQGFAQLLVGSGLRVVLDGQGDYRLEPAPQAAADSLELQSQTVTAQPAERANGPVGSYVASRSATATKTDTPLLETPQAISVISREQMDARGVTTLEEALRYTPSISVPYGFDTRYDWFSIRGFDAKTRVFRDGLVQPTSTYGLPRLDSWAMERIEVLRGPASVLYGQAEPGGIVNQVSKRPSETARNEVRLRAGSDDLAELAGDFGGALSDDGSLLYRVVMLGNDANAQVDKTGMQRQMLAPSLTWRPNADTELTVQAAYQKDDGRYGFSTHFSPYLRDTFNLPYDRDPDFFDGEPDFNDFQRSYYSVGYQLSHRLNDTWTLRQNLRYDETNLEYSYINAYAVLPSDGRTLLRSAGVQDEHMSGWGVDNQAEASFATGSVEHNLLLGLDWRRSRSNEAAYYGATVPPLDLLEPQYGRPLVSPAIDRKQSLLTRQTGLYLQDQLKLGDHWRLLLGGRYDWAQNQIDDALQADSKTTSEAFSGRAGLVYVFDNGLAPYVSYSESFNPVSGSDTLTCKPFDPERGKQYEIGVKYQPEGARSFVSLALFDLTKQDYVLNDSSSDPGRTLRRQVGEVSSRGIELEALASLAEGLDLSAFYSYTDAFVSKSPNAWEKDSRLPRTPRDSAGVWLDYTQLSGALKGFGGGIGVRYVGESRYTGRNAALAFNPTLEPIVSVESEAYTLVDASLHYQLDGMRLALNASNLLDKEYDTSCSEVTCYYGYGRTLTASASYSW